MNPDSSILELIARLNAERIMANERIAQLEKMVRDLQSSEAKEEKEEK